MWISQHTHINSKYYFEIKTGFNASFKDFWYTNMNETQACYGEFN